MKKLLAIIVSVFFFSLLSSTPAAAQLSIAPTDDAYVDINSPTTNFGTGGLTVNFSSFPSFTVTRRVLVRFDLSTLTSDLLSAELSVLTVQAPIFHGGNGSPAGSLALYSVNDDWNGPTAGTGDQNSVTWTNQPAKLSGTPLATAAAPNNFDNGATITFVGSNLTDFVNANRVANGGDDVVSFAIEWQPIVGALFDDLAIFEDIENSGGAGTAPDLLATSPTAIQLGSLAAPHTQSPFPLVAAFSAILGLMALSVVQLQRQR